MSFVKKLERRGRRFLVFLCALCLGVRRKSIPNNAVLQSILVVRLDERVGNLLLLIPFLESLRKRFPKARIDLLASKRNQQLFQNYNALSHFLPFNKKALTAADGLWQSICTIRAQSYDIAIDATNPTDPSTTQSILIRLSKARYTIGFACPPFSRLYNVLVDIPPNCTHEVDFRLCLLKPLPGKYISRQMTIGELPSLSAVSPAIEFWHALPVNDYLILHVGARLVTKQLDATTYGKICTTIQNHKYGVVLTYGPGGESLAQKVTQSNPRACIAPDTDLVELATLMRQAFAVISCDTGPMHLGIAVGTPTCGIFVSTEPKRYGHDQAPHCVIDARNRPFVEWEDILSTWLIKFPDSLDSKPLYSV